MKKIIPPCGLCGKSKKSRYKTECCGNWVCGDESDYVLFSYSRNICARNHRRFTLCGSHHAEEHKGDWKTCKECLKAFEMEMYVWYGTNEYNFEKLPDPPAFKPTYCSKCKTVISLSEGGYSYLKCKTVISLSEGGYSYLCGIYRCDNCPISDREQEKIVREDKKAK